MWLLAEARGCGEEGEAVGDSMTTWWLGASWGALVALFVAQKALAWRGRNQLRSRFKRAAAKEAEGAKVLAGMGYELVASQARAEGHVAVDRELRRFTVTADYLVERGGHLYVVEVKSGEHAPDPLLRDTRRQLREYAAVFPAEGLLLLDMERETLHQIDFPSLDRPRRSPLWLLALGIFLGFFGALSLIWVLAP